MLKQLFTLTRRTFGQNNHKRHTVKFVPLARNFCSSYKVQKVRALHFMQNNDSSFQAELKRALFVVFYDRQPLLQKIQEKNDKVVDKFSNITSNYSLCFVSYPDLKKALDEYGFVINESNIALLDVAPMQSDTNDVSEEFIPIAAVGLKPEHKMNDTNSNAHFELANRLKAEFMDLRRAYFLLHEHHSGNLMTRAQALLRWSNIFKFCPKCSSKLSMAVSKSSAQCGKCFQTYYPTISPVAITLISNKSNDHVLLVRQPRQVPGVFTAVAGFSEAGECVEDTVVRESAEEVGLDVWDVRYANFSMCWPFPQNSLMCAFRATADMAQPISLDKSELEDGNWYSRKEVGRAFEKTVVKPGFFNMDFSAMKQQHFQLVPPFGTAAHEMIKSWLLEEKSTCE